jgi:hypothetical protein
MRKDIPEKGWADCPRSGFPFQIVPFNHFVQGNPVNSQDFGGSGYIPGVFFQGLLNIRLFHFT